MRIRGDKQATRVAAWKNKFDGASLVPHNGVGHQGWQVDTKIAGAVW